MAKYNAYKSNFLTCNNLTTNYLYINNEDISFNIPLDFSKKDSGILVETPLLKQIILPHQEYIPSISFHKKLINEIIYYNDSNEESVKDYSSCFYYKRDGNSAGYVVWNL